MKLEGGTRGVLWRVAGHWWRVTAVNMTQEDRAQYPQIPWAQIVGLRHRIVHDDFGIDTELIWEIASKDAPELAALLEGKRS